MLTVPSNSSAGSATVSRESPVELYAAAFMVVFSAIRLALLLHEDDAVGRTSYRPADVDQIALGVDLLDAEMSLRVTMVAVMTGHLLALDHTRRIGARPDGARPAVLRVAVGVRSAMETMALHDALETAALRRARDFHLIAGSKDVHRHLVAEVVARHVG